MAQERKVAVLVGSLRKASYNRLAALALAKLAPAGMSLDIVEIRDLPLYDEDLETAGAPGAWTAFRDQVRLFLALGGGWKTASATASS